MWFCFKADNMIVTNNKNNQYKIEIRKYRLIQKYEM